MAKRKNIPVTTFTFGEMITECQYDSIFGAFSGYCVYEIVDEEAKTCKIVGLNDYFFENDQTVLVIPRMTTIGDNKYTVTTIGSNFLTGVSLTELTVPNSITTIEEDAFGLKDGVTTSIEVLIYQGDFASWKEIEIYNDASNPLTYTEQLFINDKKIDFKSFDDITGYSDDLDTNIIYRLEENKARFLMSSTDKIGISDWVKQPDPVSGGKTRYSAESAFSFAYTIINSIGFLPKIFTNQAEVLSGVKDRELNLLKYFVTFEGTVFAPVTETQAWAVC